MASDLTSDDVRRIVREENLRLFRVMLEVGRMTSRGYYASDLALMALDGQGEGGDGNAAAFDKYVIDYREGR